MNDVGSASVGASRRRISPALVAALAVAVFGLVAVLLLALGAEVRERRRKASAGRTMA